MNKSGLHYSSITKKIIMSLAGLFLLTFLIVHLSINLLLLFDPSLKLFNEAAHFMGTNPFIQTFQWVLFAGIIVHFVYGFILTVQNNMSRPTAYKVKGTSEKSAFSKYMIHTGVIILIFLGLHMVNFFFKKMAGTIPEIAYPEVTVINGVPVTTDVITENMGGLVVALFKQPLYVVIYVVCLLFLGFHLQHGISSAFQSMGLRHKTYTPVIEAVGTLLAIVITAGFIIIPLVVFFSNSYQVI